MKGCSCLANAHSLYSSLPLSNATHTHTHTHTHLAISCESRFPRNVRNLGLKVDSHSRRPNHARCLVQQRRSDGFGVGSASWSSVTELERELEAEMNMQEKGSSSTGMARFRDKCGEGKGVVELLECLEREAIMGEDEGKEPTDYNRRAHIFDASSRVFQALRELNN